MSYLNRSLKLMSHLCFRSANRFSNIAQPVRCFATTYTCKASNELGQAVCSVQYNPQSDL